MVRADLAGGRELVVGEARQDRGGFLVRDLGLCRRAGELVVALNEQPLLLLLVRARAHAHEVPAALQPLPIEREIEMALGIALPRVALRPPAALVPHDHGAAAVFSLRDHALEGQVFHRWSSVCTESRFSPGIRLGPRVTAQLFRTPSSSRRISKCSRRASCFWTTNSLPRLRPRCGGGSL